ncbi:hypothetical protein PLICRDRAFT_586185 [Plicaturopsis crispa FD-325 SS-3]|nr:hypothetical protein PLICRDRAFT_586185 [Plicaturopsis crispa FD-325 SS-3]
MSINTLLARQQALARRIGTRHHGLARNPRALSARPPEHFLPFESRRRRDIPPMPSTRFTRSVTYRLCDRSPSFKSPVASRRAVPRTRDIFALTPRRACSVLPAVLYLAVDLRSSLHVHLLPTKIVDLDLRHQRLVFSRTYRASSVLDHGARRAYQISYLYPEQVHVVSTNVSVAGRSVNAYEPPRRRRDRTVSHRAPRRDCFAQTDAPGNPHHDNPLWRRQSKAGDSVRTSQQHIDSRTHAFLPDTPPAPRLVDSRPRPDTSSR